MGLSDFPEVEGMQLAGISEDELRRLASHPYAGRFLAEKFEDIDLLANPKVQEGLAELAAGQFVELPPPEMH